MEALKSIYDAIGATATWLTERAFWLETAIWPLPYLAPIVWGIQNFVSLIHGSFISVALWLQGLSDIEYELMGRPHPVDLIDAWLSDLLDLTLTTLSIIGDWWAGAKVTIQGWITAASGTLTDLIDAAEAIANKAKTAFDTFTEDILPGLIDFTWWTAFWGAEIPTIGDWWATKWTEISDLWDSKITDLAPLWEGWQDFRQKVSDFFEDPLGWLESRFTDWFLGKE